MFGAIPRLCSNSSNRVSPAKASRVETAQRACRDDEVI
jgi:hypothetical protein